MAKLIFIVGHSRPASWLRVLQRFRPRCRLVVEPYFFILFSVSVGSAVALSSLLIVPTEGFEPSCFLRLCWCAMEQLKVRHSCESLTIPSSPSPFTYWRRNRGGKRAAFTGGSLKSYQQIIINI